MPRTLAITCIGISDETCLTKSNSPSGMRPIDRLTRRGSRTWSVHTFDRARGKPPVHDRPELVVARRVVIDQQLAPFEVLGRDVLERDAAELRGERRGVAMDQRECPRGA